MWNTLRTCAVNRVADNEKKILMLIFKILRREEIKTEIAEAKEEIDLVDSTEDLRYVWMRLDSSSKQGCKIL